MKKARLSRSLTMHEKTAYLQGIKKFGAGNFVLEPSCYGGWIPVKKFKYSGER